MFHFCKIITIKIGVLSYFVNYVKFYGKNIFNMNFKGMFKGFCLWTEKTESSGFLKYIMAKR